MFSGQRRSDWPERLEFALSEHRKGAYQYGQFDCAVLFSDVVWAMTDVDPFEEAGKWHSEFGALKALARTGHNTVKSFCDAKFEAIAPSMARRGDAGYVEAIHPLLCPAIVIGAEAITRDEKGGWIRFPASQLTTAYRIG